MKANKVPSERYTRTNGVIVEVYNRMEAALTKTKLTPDTVVYHGTAATFDKFALIKRNPTTPVDEVNAFFFTTDPRVAYGHARRMAKENGGKIRIIAAKLKFKSLQDMTARIKRYQREIGNFGQAKRKAYAEVDSTKHDGIEFRGDSVNTPEYVVFNPDVIDVLSHGWTEKKLTASTDAYGYWVTPKGEVLEVPGGREGHAKVFKKYLSLNEDLVFPEAHLNMIFDREVYAPLFNRGWIRLIQNDGVYDLNFLNNSLTTKSVNSLIRLLSKYPGTIVAEVIYSSTDKYLRFEKRAKLVEFLKENVKKADKTLEAKASPPSDLYGYWFTNKGEMIEVTYDSTHIKEFLNHVSHSKELSNAFNKYKADNKLSTGRASYGYALDVLGWIRVECGSKILRVEIIKNNVAVKAFNLMPQLIKDRPDFTQIHIDISTLDSEDAEYKKLEGTETRVLLSLLRKNLNKTLTAKDLEASAKIKPTILKNPPIYKIKQLIDNTDYGELKVLIVEDNVYIWNQSEHWDHSDQIKKLEIKKPKNIDELSLTFGNVTDYDTNEDHLVLTTHSHNKNSNALILKNSYLRKVVKELNIYLEDMSITKNFRFLKGTDYMKEHNLEAADRKPYGYWFTHTGERVEVKPYEHDIEAARIIVKNYNKQYMMFNKNGGENYKIAAFKLFGWIRTVNELGGISVEAWPDNVAPEAFDSFSKYIKNEVFDQIILGWARSNNSDYIREIDNHCDKVLRALYKARPMYNREDKDIITVESMDNAYGYWITANGKMLPVEHQSHNTVAEKYIVRNLYNEYFNFVMENDSQDFNTFCLTQGWLRLILLRETLGIQLFKESVAAPAFRSLTRYVEGQAFERVSIDVVSRRLGTEFMNEENRSFDIESGVKRRQASAFIRSQLRKNTLEAAAKSEVYGYWITADGELLIIKDENVGHIGTFKKYIKRENKQSEYTKDDIDSIEDLEYWPVLTRGWIRIVFEGYNIMNTEIFKKRVSPKAFSRFKSLLVGLDVNQMFLDINMDKSISNIDFESFDKKHALVKALEQNVVKELTAEESLEASNSEPYGYWFTHTGEMLDVDEMQHSKVAYDFLSAKHIKLESQRYTDMTSKVIGELGWIRIVLEGVTINIEIGKDSVSSKAVKALHSNIDSISGMNFRIDFLEDSGDTLIGSRKRFPLLFKTLRENINKKEITALDESDNTFEAWITDKGVVASPISHMRTLKSIMAKDRTLFERLNIFKRDNGFNSNAEAYAFGTRQLGFIRVVGSERAPSIMFAKNSVHPEAYRLFSKYFRDRVEPTTLVFTDALEFPYEEDNLGSTVEFKEFRQQAPLFAWVRANVKKTSLEAADKWSSDAWWVTNEGKVLEVGEENEHRDVARDYFKGKFDREYSIPQVAMQAGWIRIRKNGNVVYINMHENRLTSDAFKAVITLLRQQPCDTIEFELFKDDDSDLYKSFPMSLGGINMLIRLLRKNQMQKTIVAIDGDNNVDWVSKEEILETWRTDNKNERIDLVQRKTDYLVREFNPEGELTQESVYKFKETASDYLLQTVREKQSANIFFSKQSDLNMEAADLEQFIERWESVDGKYATALGRGEFGFFIKDYIKNQITQTFKNVSNYSLGRKTLAESEAEFKNHLTLVQKSGTQYKKVDGNKSFVTPKESKKLADAQVKVRGNSETKALDGFKPFSKQPVIPGLQVVTKKTGSYIYAKLLHKDSGLALVNITNNPLGFSPSELVTRIDNSDLSAFDWTLPSKELFSRYGNSELLQAARKFYDSLSENMKDKTDKELEGVLQNVVKDYVISKLMGLPKRAKNTRQRIDAVIKAKGLDAAKVYNYFGNVDDRTKSGRDQLLKNVGLTRVAGGYDLIKNTVKPAPEPVAAKPKLIPDKITTRIASQRTAREAAQSDKIIMPPKTGGVDDSMIGQYVVGLDGKNELKGVVLKQTRDKRTGRSSGQVVVLTNEKDPASYKVYTLSNLKRTLKKPPKALVSAFNILSARNRLEAAVTPETKLKLRTLNRDPHKQSHIRYSLRHKPGEYVTGQYLGFRQITVTIKGLLVKENETKNNNIASGGILVLKRDGQFEVREATHIERLFKHPPTALLDQFNKLKKAGRIPALDDFD